MKMLKASLILLAQVIIISAGAQQQQTQSALDYIAKYKDLAIAEMLRCKIPASVTLAQGIHESQCGKSPLAREANNHFGIKCKEEWTGKKYYKSDDAPNECFRVYEHAADSYADHSDFLITHSRYAPLFQLPITDYKSWASSLKQFGYATNPKYAQILINTIQLYNLDQYDQAGLAMMSEREKMFAPPAELASVQAAPKTITQRSSVIVSDVKPTTAAKTQSHSNSITTASAKPTSETSPVAKKSFLSSVKQTAQVTTQIFRDAPVNNAPGRKEYVVNGSRALMAQGDEDPITIAIEYNLDYERVLAFNDLGKGEHFKSGEYIFLQTKKSTGSADKYQVQAGESMRDISQKFGIKLRDLYSKNAMTYTENEQVHAGETVSLRERLSSPPHTITYAQFLKTQSVSKAPSSTVNKVTDNNTTASNNTAKPIITSEQMTKYQVQDSDTLYSIARRFNVSVEELRAMNNLDGSSIHAGQTLVVSK
jgi:LysM repeat protein